MLAVLLFIDIIILDDGFRKHYSQSHIPMQNIFFAGSQFSFFCVYFV